MHYLQQLTTFAFTDWIKSHQSIPCPFHHSLTFTLRINALVLQGKTLILLSCSSMNSKDIGGANYRLGLQNSTLGLQVQPQKNTKCRPCS